MNNLKRVLSLALASVMLIGMMAVGASAANTDFSDKAEINDAKEEAVNSLVVLNVIDGMGDGTFNPTGIVTRQQAAKMIYVALNGGKDNASLTKSNPPKFSDVTDWSQGYVEWCATKGIIAGMGDGTFNPKGELTPTQLAKLLLVAIGYDAKIEGLEGTSDWSLNTNALALAKDFYDGLEDIDPAAPMTRENAAQMIWNACHAEMVEYDGKLTMVNGQLAASDKTQGTGETILMSAYGLDNVGGSAETQFDVAVLVKAVLDDGKYTYTFNNAKIGTLAANENAQAPLAAKVTDIEDDFSALVGHKVVVLQNSTRTKFYGLVDASTVLATGAYVADTDVTATITVDGNKLTKEALFDIIGFNTNNTSVAPKDYDTITALDYDGDGEVDVALCTPVNIEKVTFVGTTNITTNATSYTVSKTTAYDGIAVDDVVLVTKAANTIDGKTVITKPETVVGKVDALQTGKIRVDGTWYTISEDESANLGGVAAVGTGTTLTTAGGLVVRVVNDTTAATAEDILYVAELGTGLTAGTIINADLGTYKGVDVRVLLPDGTNSVVKAMRVDYTTQTGGVSAAASDIRRCVPDLGLYTYTVDKNGVYNLKGVKNSGSTDTLNGQNTFGSTNYVFTAANKPTDSTLVTTTTNTYVEDTAKIGTSYFIADDAVIYLITNDDGTKKAPTSATSVAVVSGKELKALGDWGTNSTLITKKVNGLATVVVGVIYGTGKATADTTTGYGYVTSAGYEEKNADGDVIVKFTAYTAKGSEELTAVDSTLATGDSANLEYAKGAFITFQYTGTEGEVESVETLTAGAAGSTFDAAGTVAITGWDGSKNLVFDADATNMSYSLVTTGTGATKIIYIDSSKVAGVEGGAVALANNDATGVYTKNAVFAANATTATELDVLFVDVNNSVAKAPKVLTNIGADNDLDKAEIEATSVPTGVYTISTGATRGTDLSTSVTNDELLVFKFNTKSTGTVTADTFVLTIKDADENVVYKEMHKGITAASAAGKIFWIDIREDSYNSSHDASGNYVANTTANTGFGANFSGTWAGLTTGKTYSYTIDFTDADAAANSGTVLSGTFVAP